MMKENNYIINCLEPLAMKHKKQVDFSFSKHQVGRMFHKETTMIIKAEPIFNYPTHFSC